MMKFAINYSKQAAQLVERGEIAIDYFKCPDWPGLVEEANRLRPVAVHFTLKAGSGRIQKTDWKLVEQLLRQTGTAYVNLHIAPESKDFPGIPVDTQCAEEYRAVIDRVITDVQLVVNRFGADRVIVENVPYRGKDGSILRPGVEPGAIHQVLDETGCGLLLDISHARITAHRLGMDEHVYMAALPIDRLHELHFTGLHNLHGYLQDHLPVLEADWPVLDWVQERIQRKEWSLPTMLAFEYGGVGEKFSWRSDMAVIAEQAPRLYQYAHAA
jgi:uncharacterized protein (UPF0276 family)